MVMPEKSKVEPIDKVDKILDELLDAMDGHSAMECSTVVEELQDRIENDTVYQKFENRSH